jgi:glycosyltransferase involved in cell wall biosynthesis
VIHFTGNTGWGRPGPVPSVLTIQDLIFMAGAGGGRSARQVVGHAYEHWLIPRAARAADILAVSSETIAEQVRIQLGVEFAPHVVPYGVTAPPGTAQARDGARYLLAFAGRDPRKRTAEVVTAWRRLRAGDDGAPALNIELRLLASAGLPPGLRESLAPDITGGGVAILEHVPRERVWSELAGATALAYPSTDEGFGLPVLEGMAAGTPVLSGLAPATREIGGDAILQLDPRDISGSIAAVVRRLHDDPDHGRAIVARGRERASRFTWRATAEGYRGLYEEAIANRVLRARRPGGPR